MERIPQSLPVRGMKLFFAQMTVEKRGRNLPQVLLPIVKQTNLYLSPLTLGTCEYLRLLEKTEQSS